MPKLGDDELTTALSGLPGWEREGAAIAKEYKFDSFRDAIAFVNRIADIADAADHHPEMTNVYNRVQVKYWTHTEGGVTGKDVDAARQVEAAAK